ncbi:MAG: hypothetical protein D6716_00325, partial [Chloroflexi bacterium]
LQNPPLQNPPLQNPSLPTIRNPAGDTTDRREWDGSSQNIAYLVMSGNAPYHSRFAMSDADSLA